MDKKAWIAISVSIIALVLWNVFVVAPAEKRSPASLAPSPSVASAASPAASVSPSPGPASAPTNQAPPSVASAAEHIETLSFPQMIVRFTNLGGGIANVTLLGPQHVTEDHKQIQLNADGEVPIGGLGETPGIFWQAREPYEMHRDGDAIVYERAVPGQMKISKRFTVQPATRRGNVPTIRLQILFTNPTGQPLKAPGQYLYTGCATPIHRRDLPTYTECAWMKDGRAESQNVTYFEPGYIPIIGRFMNAETHPAPTFFSQTVSKLAWIGVKNQFYTTIISSANPAASGPAQEFPATEVWAKRFTIPPPSDPSLPSGPPMYGMNAAACLPQAEIAAGGSESKDFQIYAGPTQFDELSQLGQGQEGILNYGYFRPVSIFLLKSMNVLKGILGNYVWAIIVLTLCIKLVLYPLQSKANRSARQMSAVAPKMSELREKYKDDPSRAQTETMKLYKDYGINPLGGCLPALIQMPIFFGFFRMLGTAAELRNSGFLWVHDLSQPDTVAHIAGWPINILPLLMAGTMLWQMSLTPKTGDPSQQRIMMAMPLVFVLFCYNFASALSLYYTMQNLLTIVQLHLTRNQPVPALVKRTPSPDRGSGRPGSSGGSAQGGKKNNKQRVRL